MNPHDLCYQCYKHGTDFLFGKSRIKYFNDEPQYLKRIKSISSRTQTNTFFETNDKIKRRRCDESILKVMIIPVDIHQTNKNLSFTVQ